MYTLRTLIMYYWRSCKFIVVYTISKESTIDRSSFYYVTDRVQLTLSKMLVSIDHYLYDLLSFCSCKIRTLLFFFPLIFHYNSLLSIFFNLFFLFFCNLKYCFQWMHDLVKHYLTIYILHLKSHMKIKVRQNNFLVFVSNKMLFWHYWKFK